MTINMSPAPPLGRYPQDLLCGHTGITPNSANTRIMSKIVPIDMVQPPEIMAFNTAQLALATLLKTL